MRVGIVGLGNLGLPIAFNLLREGHLVGVHDLLPEAAEKLIDQGARWHVSPAALAREVNVVLTVLPSPAAVVQVMLAENGVLTGLRPGSAWIDISTNDRHVMTRLAELAQDRGVDVLESPVTGGIPKAYDGDITVFAAGNRTVFDRLLPLLQCFGGEILYLGPIGSASTAKIITNMLAFGHLWLLGEALMLGRQAGLSVGPLFEAILQSCGSSFVAETEGPAILNGSYDYGFTMALAAKDARLVSELAREVGMPLEVAGLIEQIFTRARRRYGDEAWSTQIVKLLEDDLGVDLRAAGYETPAIVRETAV
jgi:3-hydroxyisobutyrate dehydrogenase